MKVVWFNENKTKAFEWWSKDNTLGDLYFKERETPDDVWSPPRFVSKKHATGITVEKIEENGIMEYMGYTKTVIE